MKKFGMMLAVSIFMGLAATATIANAKKPTTTCDGSAVAAARQAIDAACPCAGKPDGAGGVVAWRNHGQYVSCVTKARKNAARGGNLGQQCLNSAVPCASQSTCGKSDAVACINTIGTCLDDPIPGDTLQEGACDNDSSKPCDTDADCSQAICSVMSAADCAATGGSAADGTCCSQ